MLLGPAPNDLLPRMLTDLPTSRIGAYVPPILRYRHLRRCCSSPRPRHVRRGEPARPLHTLRPTGFTDDTMRLDPKHGQGCADNAVKRTYKAGGQTKTRHDTTLVRDQHLLGPAPNDQQQQQNKQGATTWQTIRRSRQLS